MSFLLKKNIKYKYNFNKTRNGLMNINSDYANKKNTKSTIVICDRDIYKMNYNMNTIKTDISEREDWKKDDDLIFLDHRFGVLMMAIRYFLIHRDLYTQEIAEEKFFSASARSSGN